MVKVITARPEVKSRSHHDVAHLQPPTNINTKYQLPTSYSFRDIARTRFYRSRSLRQGQSSNQVHTMTLLTCSPNQCPYSVSTSYTLQFPRYSPDKILYIKVTKARTKVKSRSHHDDTPPNQCPYQVSNFYTLRFPTHSPDKIL